MARIFGTKMKQAKDAAARPDLNTIREYSSKGMQSPQGNLTGFFAGGQPSKPARVVPKLADAGAVSASLVTPSLGRPAGSGLGANFATKAGPAMGAAATAASRIV